MPASRWLDRTQPQTLMIATLLLYVNAVFDLVFQSAGPLIPLGLIFVALQALSGWGIANEKKWGYWLAVVVSVALLGVLVIYLAAASIVGLIFQVALVALLLHPQSREYKRIWFR
ncbi:MAG: hypothetical protein ACRDY0_11625 [Acidimicrobiales bacterium]